MNFKIMKNIINEKELERMVKRVVREEKLNNINESLPRRERERHQTNWRKREFEPYDRERDIMSAFGSYSNDVPPNVISYLRKNPRAFLRRVVDIYGMDKVLDFIGYQQPEMGEEYDNYMGIFKGKKMSSSDIESAKGDYYLECGKCHGDGCSHCNYEGKVLDNDFIVDDSEDVKSESYGSYMDEVPRPPKKIPLRRPSMPPIKEPNLNQDKYLKPRGLEEEEWIQNAIEKPGSLRRKMGVKKGEKLSPSDIKAKLDSLKAKDEDPTKKGVQGLGKRDLETYRQLNLAKTLRGL